MDIQLLLLQETQPTVERAILIDILKAIVPGLVVALLGLLSPQIRNLIFYKRTEYDFEFVKVADKSSGIWDIQWEGYRLTIKIDDISNDKIEGVTFIKENAEETFVKGLEKPTETCSRMKPSEKFQPLFDKELYVKLNTIIRFKPIAGETKYILRFVLRRKIYG